MSRKKEVLDKTEIALIAKEVINLLADHELLVSEAEEVLQCSIRSIKGCAYVQKLTW